jgi:LmbE family N-acetylglucosaminyl deacetylase
MQWFRAAVAALLLALLGTPAAAQQLLDSDGASNLGVALRRLGTTKRVLMIGAHPDDENTAVIAELALGDGADVAYLSLTRGEGGQNLIGPELQEALGIIRTEELLAARRLDGAQQFFTRAYDYGFSKSADEALAQWPRDTLLADVVEVVRRYRPDIIISVFSGTPADGHGQHQAAGIMAREAFSAAADSLRFRDQVARGLAPHRARYLFQALYRPPQNPPFVLSTGELDPLFGRSRFQIAMQSRSRHRSQDMGNAEPLGPQSSALTLLAGDYPQGARALFASLDTTPAQHARTRRAGTEVITHLLAYDSIVTSVRASYNPLKRAQQVPALARAVQHLDAAIAGAAHGDMTRILRDERMQAQTALQLDAGIIIDVTASTPTPVPGSSFEVVVTAWNAGPHRVTVDPQLLVPAGWQASDGEHAPEWLLPDSVARRTFHVTVPTTARRTEPYYLRQPRLSARYQWDAADPRGMPFETADVRAHIAIDVANVRIDIMRAAEFVAVDKALGELRRPLIVVPAASLDVQPRVTVIPAGDAAPRTVTVAVRTARDSVSGSLRLIAPAGWRVAPDAAPVNVARAGETVNLRFTVTAPASSSGNAVLRAELVTPQHTFNDGYTLIDYPHIRPHALYRDASVRVSRFPINVAQDLRIGYIEGAGDDGALALRQLGAVVEMLDASALAAADLARYDAIVAGIRAYEVRPDLIANNERLLTYTRNGGTFIVQYNKYEIVDNNWMPYPATMARPHGRVTDENARVTLLAPDHPVLAGPNRIAAADFDGWVQERGLYFLDTFDSRYTPLLSMADPGEDAQRGSIVAARVGRGWYVYTGLALFRQLPEGVPGAWRLLANLVSLGKTITP